MENGSKMYSQQTILSCFVCFFYFIFFYPGFLSQPITNHRTAGKGGGHFSNSSLPLPPASQTLRHWPGDYCRELNSVQRQQPDSNREPLVSERKALSTKLERKTLLQYKFLSIYISKHYHSNSMSWCMGSFIYYVHKIFRKNNISYPLIRTSTCAHQGIRNDIISVNFVNVIN